MLELFLKITEYIFIYSFFYGKYYKLEKILIPSILKFYEINFIKNVKFDKIIDFYKQIYNIYNGYIIFNMTFIRKVLHFF